MKRVLPAAVAAAAVTAVGLPAAASAKPPITPAARVDMHVRQRTYDLRREVAWVRGVHHPDRRPRLELPFGPRHPGNVDDRLHHHDHGLPGHAPTRRAATWEGDHQQDGDDDLPGPPLIPRPSGYYGEL
jgi:hypothetical protein